MAFRVALVQLLISDDESPPARLSRVLGIIKSLAHRVDLVVLPELWLTGAFATGAALKHAEPLDGPTFAALSDAARDAGLHLLAGSLSEAGDSPRPYNTAVVFGPDGGRLATYRKMHLFGFDGGEADAFSAGAAQPVVWQSPWGPMGIATCYDLRFPELFRALTDGGALAFLVPTGWPTRRIARWDVLGQARAIENQAWFIGINAVGTHSGFGMGGHSMVVAPTGDVAHQLSGTEQDVFIADIELQAALDWRERFPALRDRRL